MTLALHPGSTVTAEPDRGIASNTTLARVASAISLANVVAIFFLIGTGLL